MVLYMFGAAGLVLPRIVSVAGITHNVQVSLIGTLTVQAQLVDNILTPKEVDCYGQ